MVANLEGYAQARAVRRELIALGWPGTHDPAYPHVQLLLAEAAALEGDLLEGAHPG